MSSLWDCNTNLYLDPDNIPSEFRLFFFASELMKKKMKCGMLYLICCTLYTCLLLLWLGDISFYKVPEVANWNIIFAQAVPPSVCRTTASQDSFLWSFGTQIFTLNLIAYYFFLIILCSIAFLLKLCMEHHSTILSIIWFVIMILILLCPEIKYENLC